jgi:hypothetical protein
MVPRVPTVWKSFGILKKNSRALNRFGILWFLWYSLEKVLKIAILLKNVPLCGHSGAVGTSFQLIWLAFRRPDALSKFVQILSVGSWFLGNSVLKRS